jgi:hypothetical protein
MFRLGQLYRIPYELVVSLEVLAIERVVLDNLAISLVEFPVCEKSLIELIEGAETEDTRTEYASDAQGKPVIIKRIVTKHKQEPNVAATIFALTNLKGEVWKNKQNTDITTNGKDINQQISPAEAAALLKKLEEEV